MASTNSSVVLDLPPLPSYTLRPREPLLPFMSDNLLSLSLPIIGYWTASLLFHLIDVYDFFPQYRLHTPAELLKRNHATRFEVLRDVIIQQIIQTAAGIILAYFDDEELVGREEYDVALWAQRIRRAQRAIPWLLKLVGVDAIGLAKSMTNYPSWAGALAGGSYPQLLKKIVLDNGLEVTAPSFAEWELNVAKFIYWIFIPAFQFAAAICILDTWQYFWHRAMHLNRWLYVHFHSRHHRLYVPYAYGALYNHPVEGFLLDTAGSGVAFLATGMTYRQAMFFYTLSAVKTIDDHCGYHFPWDPLQLITSNNAAYHDIHHQSWGIKTNFSQPFFTFWDRLLGTQWQGEIKHKYERARIAAEKQLERERAQSGAASSEDASDFEPGPLDAGVGKTTATDAPSRRVTRSTSKQANGVNGRGI